MAGIVDPFPARTAKPQVEEAVPQAFPLAAARELICIVLLVVLADVTLYRGTGYAGIALLLVGAPLLLVLGLASEGFAVAFGSSAGCSSFLPCGCFGLAAN